jgi:triacylglycerol lipase
MGITKTLRSIIVLLALCFAESASAQECVVLLHGYLRSNKCMQPIADILDAKGYRIQNISYPSTDYSIQTLSRDHVAPQIDSTNCDKIHFIGHSMGGIVTRHYLSENKLSNLGNVILIATPNGGSELVSSIEDNPTLAWTLIGPAARELAPGSKLLLALPSPSYNTGIITASKSINPITSIFLLDGANDGTLTIESMKLDNMTDIINLEATHTMVLTHPDIGTHIENFLKYGRFIK